MVVKCIAGEDGRSTRGFMIEGFSLHRFCMTGMMQWQWLCEEWQWTFIRWTKRSHFQGSRDIRSGRWGQWSGSGCVVCECLRLIPRFRCGSGTCLVGDELKKKLKKCVQRWRGDGSRNGFDRFDTRWVKTLMNNSSAEMRLRAGTTQ